MADNRMVSLLREQVKGAVGFLEGTMRDVTPEMAHWTPPGTALPIGAHYAHVVVGQDGVINAVLGGGAALCAGAWANRTGLSELPPGPDPAKPGFPDWSAWSRRVKIDVPALKQFAQAVYQATDTWLGSRSDADLERPIDIAVLGLPSMPVARLVSMAVIGNALTHAGEISCLKGLQGKKGYPV